MSQCLSGNYLSKTSFKNRWIGCNNELAISLHRTSGALLFESRLAQAFVRAAEYKPVVRTKYIHV